MLKKLIALFGGSVAVQQTAQSASNPEEEALLRQIAERSKSDPLIGAKLGSKEITQRILAAMKTAQGVHIESLLCALGAVAGYSCQASLRAQAIARGQAETALLTSVETKDGKTFFFWRPT